MGKPTSTICSRSFARRGPAANSWAQRSYWAAITFVPVDGATASAAGLIEDGSYTVEMPPGEKRAQISAMKVVGRRQVSEGDPNSPVVDDVWEMIPPQYNAVSTLTVNATAGSQTQDFDLR